MSASQSIQGLIKWTQREEWRDDFEATLERHVGSACRSAGIGVDELAEIIGNHWMTTLWGCALEDIISARRGERNVAEDYLKRRGWKESAGTRDHIRALRRSTMSLYEVSDIVVGESFLARDLARAGEPVRVFERSATRSLSRWDRIAARVVTVLGKTQITGAVLPFSHQLAEEALASIERVRKKACAEAVKLARSLRRNVDDSAVGLVAGDEVLAGSAFMFSNLWLDDVLRRALNPSLPHMQNTDGEPLEFITVHFQLVSNSNPPAIRAKLDALPALRKESDAFWNWVEEKALQGKFATGRAAKTRTFGTTTDAGAIVLGSVELTANTVTLSVNSEARAARGRTLLESVLPGLVRAPLIERQTVEQMMASARDRSSAQDALRPPPNEERRIIHQGLTDHYRRTLDEPIPSLGNQSPRKAAKTGKGREKVIGWLKMLENHSAQQGRDDPVGSYDFTWMWKELGLGDERR